MLVRIRPALQVDRSDHPPRREEHPDAWRINERRLAADSSTRKGQRTGRREIRSQASPAAARAATGDLTAPPSSVTNSRRRITRSPRRHGREASAESTPRARAVGRLMTNRMVDCTTGRSGGLVPLQDGDRVGADMPKHLGQAHRSLGRPLPQFRARCRRRGSNGASQAWQVRRRRLIKNGSAATTSPSTLLPTSVANAVSIARKSPAPTNITFTPMGAAAAAKSWQRPRHSDGSGSTNNPTRVMAGTSSCSKPSCFAAKIKYEEVHPGRIAARPARLATESSFTGSSVAPKATMGEWSGRSLCREGRVGVERYDHGPDRDDFCRHRWEFIIDPRPNDSTATLRPSTTAAVGPTSAQPRRRMQPPRLSLHRERQ